MNLLSGPRLNATKQWPAIAGLLSIITLIGILHATQGRAQSPAANQEFEAVSIKPNLGCGGPGRGSGGRPSPGRVTLECAQLRDLILTAYGIYGNGSSPNPRGFRMQVLGGPGWVDSDRYDIEAKAEGNPPASQLYGAMLRALLEDRFRLKVHYETKEVPVYLLTVAKGGAKLEPAKEGSCVSSDTSHTPPQPAPGQPRLRNCGSQGNVADGKFDMYGATMESLSIQLALRLDRDVIDKTGMAGMFDIHLQVSRADLLIRNVAGGEVDPSAPVVAADSSGPSIFTALQQQLGLKLESGKGPVGFLAIDRIEKPSEN